MTEFKKTRIMNIVGAIRERWKKNCLLPYVMPSKLDNEGREILTFFETLRSPDSSDHRPLGRIYKYCFSFFVGLFLFLFFLFLYRSIFVLTM